MQQRHDEPFYLIATQNLKESKKRNTPRPASIKKKKVIYQKNCCPAA
jgi:hypothetical protein